MSRRGPRNRRRSKQPTHPASRVRRSASDRGRRHKPVVGVGGEQVEGRQAVRELLLEGRRRTRVILMPRGLESSPIVEQIVSLAREQRVRVKYVGRSEFGSSARTAAPQGVIAYADPLPVFNLIDLMAASYGRSGVGSTGVASADARSKGADAGVGISTSGLPFLLLLDGITDPGNLGAVLRTAECAGVTGVVLRGHRSAHITPAAAKAAAGAIEHLRVSVVPGLPAALRVLRKNGVWIVGLDPAGEKPLHRVGLADEAIALVLGAEGAGLSRLTAQRCDVLASIRMRGVLGSLNVSAAAAVACFEVARHR